MNTNVDVVCYHSKVLANGESPLMLRLSKDGKRRYLSLHLSVNPANWDFSKNRPKRNCPDKEQIIRLIEEKVQAYRRQVAEFISQDRDYTLHTLIQKVDKPIVKQNFEIYLDKYISTLTAENRIGYAKTFKELKSSIMSYVGTLDFYFSDIDTNWLKNYELWLRNRNNGENTIGIRFRSLRVVYNRAIEDNVVKQNSYPFDTFKVSKFHKETPKRALSKKDILRIRDVDVREITSYHTPYLQLSKDIFLFSYLGCGINLTDIANLKYSDVSAGRVTYHRQKTGKLLTFQLHPLAEEIINRYRIPENQPSDYIFPILIKGKHQTPTQKMYRIKRANKAINKALGKIRAKLDLNIDLTTYVARHSYATVLKRSGVSTSIISESLGHSSEKVTQTYLDSFENSQIDKAMENLL